MSLTMNSKNVEDFSNLHSISEDKAIDLLKDLPEQSSVDSLSEIFRALSEPTRIKIIYLLSSEEMCVHDLTTLLDSSQSSISHHLKILKLNNLVKARRDGKSVYYSLANHDASGMLSRCLRNVEPDS